MARQLFQAIAGAALLLGTVWSEAGAQAPRKITIVHGSQQIEVTHPGSISAMCSATTPRKGWK